MRSETQTVTIECDATKVFDYVADPANLPVWATGFARGVRREQKGWIVDTPQGEVGIRVETDPDLGVVDFHISPAPGAENVVRSRVVPNGTGADYVFTQLQFEGMPDEVFEGQSKALSAELELLKSLLEGESRAV